jgi:maltose alpha-D-glucosyltransferase/alpha-amylase
VQKAAWSDPRDGGHWVLQRLKSCVRAHSEGAVLIGEADVDHGRYEDFLGEGRQLDGLFDFFMNNHLFLALARERGAPLAACCASGTRRRAGPCSSGSATTTS